MGKNHSTTICMLCLSHPCIIIIRKFATRPLYNLFPNRTGPMKQGLCSVVLEEAQRLSDPFHLFKEYLCPPVVNLLTLPANHLSIAVSGSKSSTEEPPATLRKLSKVSRWSLILQSFFTRFMRENILSTLAFVNSMMTIDE